MQLEGLHWSWRVSGEAEDIFTTRKREQALDAGGEADGGENRYRVEMPSWKTRNMILEDFPRVIGRQLSFYNNEAELMSF